MLERHEPRQAEQLTSTQLDASEAAKRLYNRAKEGLKAGAVVVFGTDSGEIKRALRGLRHRSNIVFDHRPYSNILARFERLHPCPAGFLEEGKTPSQEFFALLFENPEEPYAIKIRTAVFLVGWEKSTMLSWCHCRLETLARAIVDEDDDGIAFSKIPAHAV